MKKLKIGIIGVGRLGYEHACNIANRVPGSELVAIADANLDRAKQVAEEIRKFFPRRVFEIVVPRNVRLVEASSYGKPIMLHDPKCAGARAYKALTQEYLNRETKK